MSSPDKRPRPGARRLTFAAVRKLALALPGVTEGTSYGTPAFKVRGKFLTRLREDGESLVFTVSCMEERDALLEADPAVFHITDHYRDHPHVLVRLKTARPAVVAGLLEQSWRRVAPPKLIAELDDG